MYNEAIDDTLDKRRPAKKAIQGRDSKALDGGTMEARRMIALEKAKKKAEVRCQP